MAGSSWARLAGPGLGAVALTIGLGAGGCNLIAFGVMAADKEIPRTVQPMYTGLAGKSFAVVVATDRTIEADFPGVVPKVIGDVSERLAQQESIGATGYIPADRVMSYLYSHPNWVVRPMSDLTKSLGVDRLIFVEITEYRLNEPGNSYIWNGVAAGTVQVYEGDSPLPDDPAFDRVVQVGFPDGSNTGENDMAGNVVGTELVRRFVDRVSWLFYKHDERKDIAY